MAPRCHDNFVTPIFYDLASVKELQLCWLPSQAQKKWRGSSRRAKLIISTKWKICCFIYHRIGSKSECVRAEQQQLPHQWYTVIKWMMMMAKRGGVTSLPNSQKSEWEKNPLATLLRGLCASFLALACIVSPLFPLFSSAQFSFYLLNG